MFSTPYMRSIAYKIERIDKSHKNDFPLHTYEKTINMLYLLHREYNRCVTDADYRREHFARGTADAVDV